MNADEILEQIKGVTAAPAAGKYLSCVACGAFQVWDSTKPVPTTCQQCKSEDARWGVGNTIPEAKQKAEAIRQTPPTGPVQGEPPKQDEKAPVSEPVKPKAKERAKPTVKKVELIIEPAIQTQPVEIGEQAIAGDTLGAKERRKQAIDMLIQIKGLNTIEYRPVGTARVFEIGFTEWVDNKPMYTFMSVIDTPESFRNQLAHAKKSGANVDLDAVRLTTIKPSELTACLYNGNLIASRMAPDGPIDLKPKSEVVVGARITKSGFLTFNVLKVVE